MTENQKTEYYYKIITNPNYKFNNDYGLIFLTPESYVILGNALSELRKRKEIDSHFYHTILGMYKHQYMNFYKIKDLNNLQPRIIAQKFIGKKKIREFIFKRDGYRCLSCGKETELTLDHIIPIRINGANSISNLQTLCKSCNSKKSSTYKDYRNGAR